MRYSWDRLGCDHPRGTWYSVRCMNMRKIFIILLICALILGCVGVVGAEDTDNSSNTNTGDGNKNKLEGSPDGKTGNETNAQQPTDNEINAQQPTDNETNTQPPTDNETNAQQPTDNETNAQQPTDNETNTQPPTDNETTTTTPIPKKDLEASINANVTKGSAPLTVNFTAEVDDSLVARYKWDVHDDEGYMDGRSVEYTYKEAGEYTVTLTLTPKDTTTYSTTEITKTITVTQEKLEAIISASEEEGVAPLKITFTGTAKGNPVSWEWDFDDGSSLIKYVSPFVMKRGAQHQPLSRSRLRRNQRPRPQRQPPQKQQHRQLLQQQYKQ